MRDRELFQNTFTALKPSQSMLEEVLQMRKIEEVTQAFGLLQIQIGLYIREELIHPAQDAKKHWEAGVLTEGEVQQLRAVQCLRTHEFGVEEIRYLSVCAEASGDYLRQRSEEKKVQYQNQEDVLAAVAVLQTHAPEGKELEKQRRRAGRYGPLPAYPQNPPSFFKKHGSFLALSAILLLLLVWLLAQMSTPAARIMVLLTLFAIGAMIALGGGVLYLVRRKPPREYAGREMAVIEKVDRESGFNASFAIGKSIVPGTGFREQGQGGIWQVAFMFWNEIRPDAYFPLVKLRHNGEERIATFPFGGFRHTWKAGDTIPVYVSEKDNGLVYPENTAFMVKKSAAALCLAFLLGGVFCREIGPVYRAANYPFIVDDLREILCGVEEATYEGTEEISDSEALLVFSHFTGTKTIDLVCKKGDCLYVQTTNIAEREKLNLWFELRRGAGKLRADQLTGDLLSEGISVYSIWEDGIYTLEMSAYQAAGQLHAVVSPGKEIAEQVGNALYAFADSQTLALEATYRLKKEDSAEEKSLFCYDQGRYYQRTERKQGELVQVEETLFDGKSGWHRVQEQGKEQAAEWSLSPAVLPEPQLLRVLRWSAGKLTQESETLKQISYLEGNFLCWGTEEYLQSAQAEISRRLEAELAAAPEEQKEALRKTLDAVCSGVCTLGQTRVQMDEASGKVSTFRLSFDFTGEQGGKAASVGLVCYVEALDGAAPAAEIEAKLEEILKS